MPDPAFRSIAIVGTGPTGLYTLHHLLQSDQPLMITLFEAGSLAGVGLPYSPEAAQISMLANIASIEIPPLSRTYLDWLQVQPEAVLAAYGVDKAGLHDRQFLPRLLLGAWFRDELELMLVEAALGGHRIALREATRVVDVEPVGDEFRLSFVGGDGRDSLLFSHVVLATGHVWPDDPDQDAGHFVSPWTGLIEAEVPAVSVGILGSSLSGIDAAMAVACQHGSFGEGDREFALNAGAKGLQITLMSRQGLLPEADFWCPLPYRPLTHLTETAVQREVKAGAKGLLDRLWRLFVAELAAADPGYADAVGLAHLSPEGFADGYFAPRLAADPFDWAEANLAQVERNAAARRVVGWRYAILRMHEPMEQAVTAFTDADRQRFEALKRVFIDNYAAVPPQSIRRLLALHRAGCLTVTALGDGYEASREDGVTRVRAEDGTVATYPIFIDARGQKALGSEDLPFPGLRAGLRDGLVAMTEEFALRDVGDGRIFLPAAPYLLKRLPFAQGICASADMGAAVAQAILPPAQAEAA
jgi:uncharacterized NAD(P)/FAD-binding protein YdhS